MDAMKLVVVGANGRMGRTLLRAAHENPACRLVAAVAREGSNAVGLDAGELAGLPTLGLRVTDDPLEAFARADGVLDFTLPAGSVEHAGLAAQARIVHVCGATGLSDADMAKLRAASRHTAVVHSGNMSLGVTLLAALVRRAAAALGTEYDVEIVEMHHNRKVDAPSGTALLLGEAAAAGRGVTLEAVAKRGRDGHTGERASGEIGFASLRGGTVTGEHDVVFAGPKERVVLRHVAEDRSIFAAGAVRAALWARAKKPGLYSMADVLGLTEPA